MSHSDSDDASFHSQEEGESNYEQNYKLHYLIWEQDYSNVAKYIRKVSNRSDMSGIWPAFYQRPICYFYIQLIKWPSTSGRS